MHILESKELHASNNQIDLYTINHKKQNCAIFNFNKLRQYQGCKSSAHCFNVFAIMIFAVNL
jgi:hypothetical protein